MTGVEVGTVHASFTFGEDEAAAGKAWREIEEASSNVSCWRYCSPDRSQWFLTVMTEEKSRAEVERATAIATALGAEPSDEAERTGMLDALRERRLATAVEAVATGQRDVRQRAHYGKGARLHRDGRMEPTEGGKG